MKDVSRRKMLKMTAAAMTIPVTTISVNAIAGGHQPKVDPEDPQAKALQYTNESTKADQNCANCRLYTGGDAEWGGCAIFAGKEVAGTGWCSAWVAKG